MDNFYTVKPENLAGLSPEQAVRLFHALLCAEAQTAGITKDKISVPFEIDTPDGGVDAEVRGVSGDIGQGLIKQGLTRYQIKTGGFSLRNNTDVKSLLISATSGELKPRIKTCLDAGGTLVAVLFGSDQPDSEDDAAKNKIIDYLKGIDSKYASAKVEVIRPNNVIAFLENYPSIRLALLGRGDLPFYDTASLGEMAEMKLELQIGEPQEQFISGLQAALSENVQPVHIRIIGEPGIGKTRLTYEALKADALSPLVIYCESPANVLSSPLINHLTRSDNTWHAVLVVDECDVISKAELWNKLQSHSPRIKLITIFNEDDESRGTTTYLDIPQLSDDQIQDVIASYGTPKNDTRRFTSYCDGSPRVAHVLGQNLKNNPDNLLANPETIDVWGRYIAGRDDPNSDAARERKAVLMWLSLFKRFGYKSPLNNEAELIAKMIEKEEGINLRKFQRIVEELRQRKILQGETTLYITPKLLHIWLWTQWWNTHGSAGDFDLDSFTTVDDSTDPPTKLTDKLVDWFYEMFRYASESDAATRVVGELLGPDGPLRDYDFLDTKRGSKFFLFLAEADPNGALTCLKETIGQKSKDQLLKFGEGRRSVVWALERLVVEKRHFPDAADLTLKLAEAENETWSNNATGLFTSLFSPAYGQVAITEASPKERFPLLKQTIESSDKTHRELGLKAAEHALETHFYKHDIGAEYRGLKRGIKLWMPETYGELFDAYRQVWRLLVEKVDSFSGKDQDEVVSILLRNARGVMPIGELAEEVVDTLVALSKKSFVDPQKVLAVVVQILHYDKKKDNLSKNVIARLEKIKADLTGTDYHSLMQRYVGLDLLEDHFTEAGKQIEGPTEQILKLAKQSVKNPELLEKELLWLTSPKPQNGFKFGYDLGVLDKENKFLPTLLAAQKKQKEQGGMFLGGYFRALRERDVELWEDQLDRLAVDSKTQEWVPELTWRSGMTDRSARRILKLAQNGDIGLGHFRMFGVGSAIEPLSEAVLVEWVEYLLAHEDPEAISIALDYCHFYYVMKSKAPLNCQLIERVLMDDRLFTNQERPRNQMDDYHWTELAKRFLEECPSDSVPLAVKMLEHLDEDNTILSGYHSSTTEILNQITEKHPKEVWEKLTELLKPPFNSRSFGLTHWLGGEINFGEGKSKGTLTLFPRELLWKWVDEDVENRAWFLASFVPADLSENSIAREVLVRYGNRDDVSSNLISNFWSEGWSGPASQHYIQKKERLLKYLEKETDPNVIKWINRYIKGIDESIKRAKIEEERSEYD